MLMKGWPSVYKVLMKSWFLVDISQKCWFFIYFLNMSPLRNEHRKLCWIFLLSFAGCPTLLQNSIKIFNRVFNIQLNWAPVGPPGEPHVAVVVLVEQQGLALDLAVDEGLPWGHFEAFFIVFRLLNKVLTFYVLSYYIS